MAPTTPLSSGSSKRTSNTSKRTQLTGQSSLQSSATRTRQARQDRFLASEIETMRLQTSPRDGPTTRSMTGSLKRKPKRMEGLEFGTMVRSSPKRKKTTVPDQTVGSPWDATIRTRLNVDDLDLDVSYVDALKSKPVREPARSPRRPRWQHHGDQPLIDVKKLPEGWNTREPDLDPDDIEAQIQRCKERIEDNIMPHTFQVRLKEYEEQKAEREEMARGEPSGLDWNVIRRIDYLKKMKADLEKSGDGKSEIANLEALLKAYRSRKLPWTGLVTYWSKGQQLCEPRPFNWDEFEAINRKFHGHNGFWVEGYIGPGPASMQVGRTYEVCERGNHLHYIRAAVRLLEYDWWEELEFMHDTGASIMTLFEEDFDRLMGPFRPPQYPYIPELGNVLVQTGNGIINRPGIEVEVTLLDAQGKRMCQWIRVPCLMKQRETTRSRVDGPWIRHVLWNGYAPDGNHLFYVANSKGSLNLPRRCPARKSFTTIAPPDVFVHPNGIPRLRRGGAVPAHLVGREPKTMPPPGRGAPRGS